MKTRSSKRLKKSEEPSENDAETTHGGNQIEQSNKDNSQTSNSYNEKDKNNAKIQEDAIANKQRNETTESKEGVPENAQTQTQSQIQIQCQSLSQNRNLISNRSRNAASESSSRKNETTNQTSLTLDSNSKVKRGRAKELTFDTKPDREKPNEKVTKQNKKSDSTDRTRQTNQTKQANRPDQNQQSKQADLTDQTDKINQTNQNNQTDKTNLTNQMNHTHQIKQTRLNEQTDQTSLALQTKKVKPSEQSYQTYNLNQTKPKSKANQTDQLNPTDQMDINRIDQTISTDENYEAESEPEWEESSEIPKHENENEKENKKGESNLIISINIKSNEDQNENEKKKNERRVGNRASAWDKECAKIIHSTHILCILSRMIMINKAIDDCLLQSALISLIPTYLNNFDFKSNSRYLKPLLNWFSRLFRIIDEEDFPFSESLASNAANAAGFFPKLENFYLKKLNLAVEKGVATNEMVVALFVSLCRGLGLNTRFISVLDVSSLKPNAHLIDLNKKLKEKEKKKSRSFRELSIFNNQNPYQKSEEKLSYQNLAKILSNSLSKSINVSNLERSNLTSGRALDSGSGFGFGSGPGPGSGLDLVSGLRSTSGSGSRLSWGSGWSPGSGLGSGLVSGSVFALENRKKDAGDDFSAGDIRDKNEKNEIFESKNEIVNEKTNSRIDFLQNNSKNKKNNFKTDGSYAMGEKEGKEEKKDNVKEGEEEDQMKKDEETKRKRKGDEEFERDLQLAMLATSASNKRTAIKSNLELEIKSSTKSLSLGKSTSNLQKSTPNSEKSNPNLGQSTPNLNEKGKAKAVEETNYKNDPKNSENYKLDPFYPNLRNENSMNMSKKVESGSFWTKKKHFILNWAEILYEEKECLNEKEAKKEKRMNRDDEEKKEKEEKKENIENIENRSRRWVCVDVIRNNYDNVKTVENNFSVYKIPLRYVIAFNQYSVKDVTKRYVTHWSKISSLRIEEEWFERTLKILQQILASENPNQIPNLNPNLTQPPTPKPILTQLEAPNSNQKTQVQTHSIKTEPLYPSFKNDHGSETFYQNVHFPHPEFDEMDQVDQIEDMEFQIKSLTEPFPKSQRDFKNHHLYALEKFLKKDEVIFPKTMVLGFINGERIYPRTCVKRIFSKQKWYKEGKIVKEGEKPIKLIKIRKKQSKRKSKSEWNGSIGEEENDYEYEEKEADKDAEKEKEKEKERDEDFKHFELFGEWQTFDYQPPTSFNGLVPKNQHGNVELWSYKFLPRGTVHLRLPRVASTAKTLGFDFAPAMIGFEFKNGKTYPKFEGIVVCQQFEEIILDAYNEEERMREEENERRRKAAAMNRWRALLRSIITRERLRHSYEGNPNYAISDHGNIMPNSKSKSFTNSEANFENQKSFEVIDCGEENRELNPKKRKEMNDEEKKMAVSSEYDLKNENLDASSSHLHSFPLHLQIYDEETGLREKKCVCGFSMTIEEL